MRHKILAAFAFGFAAGVMCLAIGLWWTGRLPVPGLPVPAFAAPSLTVARAQPPELKVDAQPAPTVDLLRNPPPSVASPAPPPVELETSARLAMPIAGVDPTKLHSNFDLARDGRRHEALDIMAPRGTPVMAVGQGNVVKLFNSKQGGLTVYQFDDTRTFCYYYAHLDRYAPGLKEGTLLRKGDVLGYVGSTGDASPDAPHLHLAVFRLGPEKEWWKGTALDPLPLLK